MPQTTLAQNPFMMMLNPEVVLAAMERSERLNQLNRHLCRPLDRAAQTGAKAAEEASEEGDMGDDSATLTIEPAGDTAA